MFITWAVLAGLLLRGAALAPHRDHSRRTHWPEWLKAAFGSDTPKAMKVQPARYFHDFPDLTGTKVSLEKHTNAQCLDGSPGAFYLNEGAANTKYYIFKQGGGMCGRLDGCAKRAQSQLGSSLEQYGWAKTLSMKETGGFPHVGFSRNKEDNPLMHDWTFVYLIYCDGSYYSGDNMTVTKVATEGGHHQTLHFKGSHIMEATINELALNYGLKGATDVVLAGCSAGGISTVASRDWVKGLVEVHAPMARFVGFSCSGFFLDYDYARTHYTAKKHFIYQQANAARVLNKECVEMYTKDGNQHKCLVAQISAHFSKTPLFLWESLFDTYMLKHTLESNCESPTCANEHGRNMRSALYNLWHMHEDFGGFLSACNHHCEAFGKGWDIAYMTPIDGLMPLQAFYCWYKRLERRQPITVWGKLVDAVVPDAVGDAFPTDALCKYPDQRYWAVKDTDYATAQESCPAGPDTKFDASFDVFE